MAGYGTRLPFPPLLVWAHERTSNDFTKILQVLILFYSSYNGFGLMDYFNGLLHIQVQSQSSSV